MKLLTLMKEVQSLKNVWLDRSHDLQTVYSGQQQRQLCYNENCSSISSSMGKKLTIHQKPRLPFSFVLFYVRIQTISSLIRMPKNRAVAGQSSLFEPTMHVSFQLGFFKDWAAV